MCERDDSCSMFSTFLFRLRDGVARSLILVQGGMVIFVQVVNVY